MLSSRLMSKLLLYPVSLGLALCPALAQAERIDYLTFAQGALLIKIAGDAPELRVGEEKALAVIDGNPGPFVVNRRPALPESVTEFVYELPADTTFDRFAVPGIFETPSPSQTFVGRIQILGSVEGPDNGFTELARGTLETHDQRGQITEIPLLVSQPVRWLMVRLSGGIDVRSERFFQDFTELIGNGTQETVPLLGRFQGVWKFRSNLLELIQEGPIVTGCYDRQGDLEGTVSGNILRAIGIDRSNEIPSTFVLTVTEEGEIRGVRSTNGAPFRNYPLPQAPAGTVTRCSKVEVPSLGCGSVIHGINFDFDSARIRSESSSILADLYTGLGTGAEHNIVVVGHTSSEGPEQYNQSLSERRAQAVVDDLVGRGLDASRIQAAGRGESMPIASNLDEAGRSLNRRVEIKCTESQR